MKQAGKSMHNNNRIVAYVLTLCMVAYMFTGVVITAKASAYSSITTNTTLSNGDTLSGTISNCTVTIPSGVTVTVTGQITTSGTVNLVGGGKLLRGSSFTSASMFRVNSGSTLNVGTSGITGITIDGISTTVSLHGGGITSNGGTVNLYSGAIISNHYISKSDGMGGGIYIASGTLNMYNGATVKDNKTTVTGTNGGGGIAIDEGAVFNMYGGTICGNSAPSAVPGTGGGGIFMSGTLNMYGGTISGNSSGRNGGAVHIDGGTNTTGTPVMNMTGGLITGNSAMFGGGIEILAKAILNISAGKINSNTCTTAGGGIELDASGYSGALNINGSAEVTGNNKSGAQNNILIDKSITVVGNFTGSAGIIHESSTYNNAGQIFGTAGASYTGMENFFCDGKSLVGTISGTSVKWKSSTTALTGITLSSNSPKTGATVTSTLSPSGASATYQWYRNTSNSNSGGTVIVGATENSYTPVSADVGKYLYVVANGTGGCTGIVTSSATTSAVQYGATVSTPTFSVAAGTYISSKSVEISCSTIGADIYYTTDGSIPTSGSTKYTGAITVSSTTTIKSIAVKPDCADSGVASATYTIAVITATPYTGIYDSAVHDAVTLSGTQAGDVVTYSEDGMTYTATCPQFTGAGSYTIYAKVSRTGAGEWESGEKTAVISKAAGSITITGDPSKTCNGSPVSDPAVSKNGTGAVTYSYYADNSGTIGTLLSGAPSNQGTYWVKAVMAQDSNYTSAEGTRQFTISASAGELSVSFLNSGFSGQNLTMLGDVDWAVWGYAGSGTSTSLSPDNKKTDGTAISALTDIDPGTHDVLRGLGQFRINHTFNWSNGTSPASATNVYTGIQHNVQATKETGDGFSFTVPADTQKRRLIVYSAIHYAVGELTATLSDGSAAQVTLQQDSKTAVNSPSRFIIDYAAAADGQTLTIQFVVTWNDNDGNGNAQIYAVALSNYHTATINVCKDGVPTDASGSIELRQSGSTIATAASTGSTGVYSALVLNGNYDIYIDGADSGTDLTINAADNSATINYYTVNYAVTDANKASGSTISATAGGSAITNGSVVPAGKQVIITATGNGADSYTYAWTGDGTSGQTTRSLTVALSGKLNALCTVSGKIKLPAPTGLIWDGTTSGKAVWSEVANANGYSVQLYRNGSALGSAQSTAADTFCYDFTSDIAAAGNGLYTFKVTAKGDGTSYSDSNQSSASGGYDINTVPSFAGIITSLTVDENSGGNSISSLLHVRDIDSGQTLTWSVKTAPGHGSLTFTGATASTGSTDITPGGSITYSPAAGYYGSDSFTVQVSDGKAAAERTVSVTVIAVPDKLPVPSTLSWDSAAPGKATWSAVNNASGYSVQLYKDGNALDSPVSVSAGTQYFDFTSMIKTAGNGLYIFKVTAKGDGTEYCDSDVSSSISIYNYVAPAIANAANNSAAANPANMTLGGSSTLTAAGDRQNEPGIASGDERYIPKTWTSSEAGKAGNFEKNGSAYTSTYTPSAAGSYTVTVMFIKQIYNGSTWTDVSGGTVTKTLAITASQNYFTVRFEDWNGTLLKQQSVAGGTAATAPADPVRTGYTFTGWSASFDAINADLTVMAQYKVSSFTVRFKDWDDTVLKTQTVEYGQAAAAPSDPKRTGYTFTGWDKDYDEITKNTTMTAQYKINTCMIIFNTDGGSVVESQTVEYGGRAVQPKDPVKDGYAFGGWYSDSSLKNAYDFSTNIISNITIFAKWTAAAGSAQTAAQAAAQLLTLETAFQFAQGDTWECVTSSFVMLGGTDSGARVTWASSNTNVVRIEQNADGGATGIVTRPADDDNSVVITAAVSKDGETVSKTFLLIVKRQGASKEETRKATDRTANVQAGDGTSGETICRTTLNNGTSIDYVTLTTETVRAIIKQGSTTDHIVVTIDNDESDQADEFAFEVSSDTVSALVENGLGVTLESPAGAVMLSAETLRQASQNGNSLYFRIVPVADEADDAEEAFRSDGAIFSLSNAAGQVFGTPKTIQTNMESFATTIILPLEGLSEQQIVDEEFLKSLYVYVEHDDGTTELVYGTLVYTDNVPTGIQFDISKFSRFQVVSVSQAAGPWVLIICIAGGVLLILLILLLAVVRRRRSRQ